MPKPEPISKTLFADTYRELQKLSKSIQQTNFVAESNVEIVRDLLNQFKKKYEVITAFSLKADQELKLKDIRNVAPKEKRHELNSQVTALMKKSDELKKDASRLMQEVSAVAERCFAARPSDGDDMLREYKAKRAEAQKIIDKLPATFRLPLISELNQLSRRVNTWFADLADIKELVKFDQPFFRKLSIKHIQPMVSSYTAQELRTHPNANFSKWADVIQELQTHASAGEQVAYAEKYEQLKAAGVTCRSTKGTVYFTKQENKTVEIEIALQVKGHSLTWYFWAPGALDQYPQTFRDELFNQAAVCHKKVDAGCDLYYRGSNAVHIKLMHTHESESSHNHNHYRLKDNKSYTPHEFRQHMEGFVGCEIEGKYFKRGEIEKICHEFEMHYLDWTSQVGVEMSKEERYFSDPAQRLNTGDMIELSLFGRMQEPCRLSVEELKVDYDEARAAIEAELAAPAIGVELVAPEQSSEEASRRVQEKLLKLKSQYETLLEYRRRSASRGLNSSIASSRQVDSSSNEVIRARQTMDDGIGIADPGIPDWALRLKASVDESKAQMLALAAKRHEPGIAHNDEARKWAGDAGIDVDSLMGAPGRQFGR